MAECPHPSNGPNVMRTYWMDVCDHCGDEASVCGNDRGVSRCARCKCPLCTPSLLISDVCALLGPIRTEKIAGDVFTKYKDYNPASSRSAGILRKELGNIAALITARNAARTILSFRGKRFCQTWFTDEICERLRSCPASRANVAKEAWHLVEVDYLFALWGDASAFAKELA